MTWRRINGNAPLRKAQGGPKDVVQERPNVATAGPFEALA